MILGKPPSRASTLNRGSEPARSESGRSTTITGGCADAVYPVWERNPFSPAAMILSNSGPEAAPVVNANPPSGERDGALASASHPEMRAETSRGSMMRFTMDSLSGW